MFLIIYTNSCLETSIILQVVSPILCSYIAYRLTADCIKLYYFECNLRS